MFTQLRHRRVVVDLLGEGPPWTVRAEDEIGRTVTDRIGSGEEGARLREFLQGGCVPFREYRGAHPRTLPIFVRFPMELYARKRREEVLVEYRAFEEQIRLDAVITDYASLIRLPRRGWRRRSVPKLPLSVTVVGGMGDAAFALLRERDWVREGPVPGCGLTLHALDAKDFEKGLPREATHVLIPDILSTPRVLKQVTAAKDPALRPRLILIRREAAEGIPLDALALPHGTTLMVARAVPDADWQHLISEVVLGVTHDLSLHDVARTAARNAAVPTPPVVLSDPAAVENLRLSDIVENQVDRAIQMESSPSPGRVKMYLAANPDAPKILGLKLGKVADDGERFENMLEDASTLPRDTGGYMYETMGFVPVSEFAREMESGAADREAFRETLKEVADDADVRTYFRERASRRVDIAMLRRVQRISEAMWSSDAITDLYVNRRQALGAGVPYSLCVRIGKTFRESLLAKLPPPVDPLLPSHEEDPEIELDITLFEQDFVASGQRVQTVKLPSLAASKSAKFRIRAPDRTGSARMRVGVFYGNHLLQSFRIDAEVLETEKEYPEKEVTKAELVFSRTDRIRDVSRFADRTIAIGTNDSTGGTHDFMVKRDGKARTIRLNEAAVSGLIDPFRDLLAEATFKGSSRRFPVDEKNPSPKGFEDIVLRMAAQGEKLFLGLFEQVKPLGDTLRALRGMRDRTIQILNHSQGLAFPWAAVYDFDRPDPPVGAPPPKVCRGLKGGRPCGHGPDAPGVVCVNGFWGVRHRIETLIPCGDAKDKRPAPLKRRGKDAVRLALGIDDPYTKQFTDDMAKQFEGGGFSKLGPAEDLLAVLWGKENRPSVAMILGHLETEDKRGEPSGPRIKVTPRPNYLRAEDLLRQAVRKRDLTPPRPLVLLLACGSGALDVASFVDILSATVRVGAAAAVGTECVAFTDLLARFGKEVTAALWGGDDLGTAVQEFRKRLFIDGNPLGFVFTAYGDAGLTVAEQGGNQ